MTDDESVSAPTVRGGGSGATVPHRVLFDERSDGTILLRSAWSLGPVARSSGEWLHRWAREAPERVFVAERSGDGWRELAYAEALEKTRAIGAALLGRGLGAGTPILILSGAGVDHALLALAAQYVGVPTVPLAEQYSLVPEARERLRQVASLVRPALVWADDAARYAEALALDALDGIEKVASEGVAPGRAGGVTAFDALLAGDGGADVDAAHAAVGPDTVAKIMLTSGSTSAPKGVPTTQRMLCANQTQLSSVLPLLVVRSHRIVDWLPWNHVFGGSHNFNLMLANGGSLYVDDGRPLRGRFARTLENLSMVAGTLSFNVPVGFTMLLEALRADRRLRGRFFAELELLFYAGASLPAEVWRGFERMAREERGTVPPMISSWGLTETAPASVMVHEPTATSGIIGVPLPGVTVKLVPDEGVRHQIRVKGPNVMTGYFRDPGRSAACFDEEGFFVTGDAVRFVDPTDRARGLAFEGRVADDFKLASGTWVRAAALRLDALSRLAPLAADVVVTGHDREWVGLLVFPDRDALEAAGIAVIEDEGALVGDALAREIAVRLAPPSARGGGSSSTRIARALVVAAPPSVGDGEITAKGNLNNGRVLEHRAVLLARLYAEGGAGSAARTAAASDVAARPASVDRAVSDADPAVIRIAGERA